MVEFIENILAGVRQWVNGKFEDLSHVVSNHINELRQRVNDLSQALSGKQNDLGIDTFGDSFDFKEVDGETAVFVPGYEYSSEGQASPIEFVDLGLPSGTLWAKCNLGATAETGYGKHYFFGTKYAVEDGGVFDASTPYEDAAEEAYGTPWQVPSKAQFEELMALNYEEVIDYQGSGVDGILFTGTNGNTLFMPYAGYTTGASSPEDENISGAYQTGTGSKSDDETSFFSSDGDLSFETVTAGEFGCTIRPVTTTNPNTFQYLTLLKGGRTYVKGVGSYDGTNHTTSGVLSLDEYLAALEARVQTLENAQNA